MPPRSWTAPIVGATQAHDDVWGIASVTDDDVGLLSLRIGWSRPGALPTGALRQLGPDNSERGGQLTLIRRGLASSAFGSTKVRTPSFISALILP